MYSGEGTMAIYKNNQRKELHYGLNCHGRIWWLELVWP